MNRWTDDRLDDFARRTEGDIADLRRVTNQLSTSGKWTPAAIAVAAGPIGAALITAGLLAVGH